MTDKMDDVYLGDGVYAGFDGFYVNLDLRGQDQTTRIDLEPDVLQALDAYRAAIDRKFLVDRYAPKPQAETRGDG